MIGQRLGPYEITAKLGEGGMGEVYRATDSRLKREVAIKVLPPAFTEDKERLARFEREAQLLAQLHHPNIASIFGLEESGGVKALVMELVDGPTLAERLEQGPLSFAESLSFALQIAQALEEAHDKGIVHRDLKPQNVKASSEGKAKVLDFGLAKAMDPGASSASAADLARSPTIMNSPTLTAVHGTQLGVILGTAGYMAPEQARGAAVDKRADIWAFGVVFYEMLSGKRLFEGETVSDTLAAVLRQEIDWKLLPEATPPAIRSLLRRCLERNPKNRLHDIADARLVLQEDAGSQPEAPPPAPVAARRPWLPWIAAALAVGGAGYLGGRGSGPSASSPAPGVVLHARLGLEPAEALLGSNPNEIRVGSRRPSRTAIALSPDGRWLAFTGEQSGTQQLFLRDLRHDAAVAVGGTTGADNPFFSPDGRWIGFWSDGALRKVPVDGGPAIEICKTGQLAGADWAADGRIAFSSPGDVRSIQWVSADGGAPAALTRIDPATHESAHLLPRWLPGGRILYTAVVLRAATGRRLVAQSEDGSGRQVLVENATDGRLVADGRYLLFLRGSTLMAARYDAGPGTLAGGAVGMVAGVLVSLNAPNSGIDVGAGQFATSAAGTLVYLAGGMHEDSGGVLTWMDRQGRLQPIEMDEGSYMAVRFSPDGNRILGFTGGSRQGIWVYDVGRRTFTRLPFDGEGAWPIWTPDGKNVVFWGRTSTAGDAVYQIAADGTGRAAPLPGFGEAGLPCDWSHDGDELVYLDTATGVTSIQAFSLSGRTTRALVQMDKGGASYAAVSPDGRWLAYMTNESGRTEVFVQPYAGGARTPVSTHGGQSPRWARDSRELVFVEPREPASSVYWSVPVSAGSTLTLGTPRRIGEVANGDFGTTIPISNFDVAPDGRLLGSSRRFTTPPPPKTLELITNWFDELETKVSGR